jgi:hypothetical protein
LRSWRGSFKEERKFRRGRGETGVGIASARKLLLTAAGFSRSDLVLANGLSAVRTRGTENWRRIGEELAKNHELEFIRKRVKRVEEGWRRGW